MPQATIEERVAVLEVEFQRERETMDERLKSHYKTLDQRFNNIATAIEELNKEWATMLQEFNRVITHPKQACAWSEEIPLLITGQRTSEDNWLKLTTTLRVVAYVVGILGISNLLAFILGIYKLGEVVNAMRK